MTRSKLQSSSGKRASTDFSLIGQLHQLRVNAKMNQSLVGAQAVSEARPLQHEHLLAIVSPQLLHVTNARSLVYGSLVTALPQRQKGFAMAC